MARTDAVYLCGTDLVLPGVTGEGGPLMLPRRKSADAGPFAAATRG